MNNLIGTKIDHHEIHAPFGEGCMGAVYRAYDLNRARPVVLKVMNFYLDREQRWTMDCQVNPVWQQSLGIGD